MIKFDAKKEASKLQKNESIFGIKSVYGTLDGAVNVYSTIKSYFDFSHCTESQAASLDAMHEWISTPVGLAVTLSSSLFFMAFVNRANVYEKSPMGRTWKYLREGLQASRNAFKGVRSTILTTALFSTSDLRYLILPTTLGLGGVYVMNRLLMLGVKTERDQKVKDNEAFFAHLMNYGAFHECTHTCTLTELKQKKLTNTYILLDKDGEKKFVFIDEKEEPSPIVNRYILYKASPLQKEQLYYIDHDGHAEPIQTADITAIREELAKNPKSLHLSLLQLHELLLPRGVAQQHFEKLKAKEIQFQSLSRRRLYLIIKAFNGFVDGLYLYIGILGILPLSPPALLFGIILSTLYCLLCIASRMYEEHQSQQNLVLSGYKAKLALAGKELELILAQYNDISIKIALETDKDKISALNLEHNRLDEELDNQLKEFEKLRCAINKERRLSNLDVFLLGIKHALPLYGALVSAVFTAVFICFMFGISLTPPCIIGVVAFGIPILIWGIVDAFYRRKPSPPIEQEQKNSTLAEIIAEVKKSFKLAREEAEKTDAFTQQAYAKNAIISAIEQCLQADPLANTFFADWAEVIRSFWAGILKGRKEIELLLNPLQQADEQGHYQDSRFMYFFIIPAAILYGLVFAFKAFAKGLSRSSSETKDDYSHYKVDEASLQKNKTSPPFQPTTKASTIQTNLFKQHTQTTSKTYSPVSAQSMFSTKQKKLPINPDVTRSQSILMI